LAACGGKRQLVAVKLRFRLPIGWESAMVVGFTLCSISLSRSDEMDTETLILAASQIASGMVGRFNNPAILQQGNNPKEIAAAAVAIAMAIGEKADEALT
jgi:hypothetical protein